MKQQANLTQAQLFLDDSWIEESTFISRQWQQPRKYPDPVLTSEHPWEGGAPVIYGTVLHWRGKFRMWYIGWTRKPDRPKERVSYAESDDGVVWKKPHLGVCEFDGHRNNNVVLDAPASSLIDDIAVIDDRGDKEWPLKALYWQSSDVAGKAMFLGHDRRRSGWGIFAARSKDGIHWDRSPGLVLPHWIDRFNAVSTRLNGKYVVYGRAIDVHHTMVRNGRSVWRTESSDLVHWSSPRLVLERDPEDPLNLEYYSASVFPYEGLTLGGLERMYMSPDMLDTELIWSHDGGVHWQRAPRRPAFLSPSPGPRRWDDTWASLPTNAPIRHHNRLWFYYSGRSTAHVNNHPRNHGAIGLATLRIDGFASLHAGERTATVVTKPMRWPKADLHINVDPRRDLESHPGFCSGELRAELRDASNKPIKGFTWDDCTPFTGNTATAENSACPALWKKNKSARALAGRTIRIAFRFRDAHLYSFRASSR